jgi:hypothetical protein
VFFSVIYFMIWFDLVRLCRSLLHDIGQVSYRTLADAMSVQTAYHWIVGWLINDDLERIQMESCCDVMEVLSQNLPGGAEENHEKPQDILWCPDWGLNKAPPKYKPRALLLHQPAWFYVVLNLERCRHSQLIRKEKLWTKGYKRI